MSAYSWKLKHMILFSWHSKLPCFCSLGQSALIWWLKSRELYNDQWKSAIINVKHQFSTYIQMSILFYQLIVQRGPGFISCLCIALQFHNSHSYLIRYTCKPNYFFHVHIFPTFFFVILCLFYQYVNIQRNLCWIFSLIYCFCTIEETFSSSKFNKLSIKYLFFDFK